MSLGSQEPMIAAMEVAVVGGAVLSPREVAPRRCPSRGPMTTMTTLTTTTTTLSISRRSLRRRWPKSCGTVARAAL